VLLRIGAAVCRPGCTAICKRTDDEWTVSSRLTRSSRRQVPMGDPRPGVSINHGRAPPWASDPRGDQQVRLLLFGSTRTRRYLVVARRMHDSAERLTSQIEAPRALQKYDLWPAQIELARGLEPLTCCLQADQPGSSGYARVPFPQVRSSVRDGGCGLVPGRRLTSGLTGFSLATENQGAVPGPGDSRVHAASPLDYHRGKLTEAIEVR